MKYYVDIKTKVLEEVVWNYGQRFAGVLFYQSPLVTAFSLTVTRAISA